MDYLLDVAADVAADVVALATGFRHEPSGPWQPVRAVAGSGPRPED